MSGKHAVPIGPALATIRDALGWKQHTLARKSKVAEGTISTVEASRRGASRDTVDALAGTLDVKVESFALYLPDDVTFYNDLLPDGDHCRTVSDFQAFIKDLVPALIRFTREEREAEAVEGSAA